jgi:hypothetical protein
MAEPGPERRDHGAHGMRLVLHEVVGRPGRHRACDGEAHGLGDVVDVDGLDRPGPADDRHDQRDGGQRPQQRRAAIGGGAEHEARAQDRPVEVERGQGRVGLGLGAHEGGSRIG